MAKAEFEWAITEPDAEGFVEIRERLIGSDLVNHYGPLPKQVAESFVRARRDFVHRYVTKRALAVRLFQANPHLLALKGKPLQ